jgi:uncharacterized membrane protein
MLKITHIMHANNTQLEKKKKRNNKKSYISTMYKKRLFTPANIPLGIILVAFTSSVIPTEIKAKNIHAIATTRLAKVYPALYDN